MKFSDTTQEHYRKLTSKEYKRTKAFLESNWSRYTRYGNDTEEVAFVQIEDDLLDDALAYAWASRIGTLNVTARDEAHF